MKLLISSFLLAAAIVTAAPITTQVSLVNGGNPVIVDNSVTVDGVTKYGVEIGPYTLKVNGHDVAGLCIDFFDDTNAGDKWTAYVTQLNSGDFSITLHPTYGQEYEEDAYLYSQIIKPGADRTDLQIAAWEIMAYGITNSNYTTTDNLADNSYIDAALLNYNKINLAGFEILTDTVNGCDQEFMIGTPEPGNLALLGFGLLAMAAGVIRRRRCAVTRGN
jgi:hypothetical protein